MTGLEGPGPGARVVVVEADPTLRQRLVSALRGQGFDAIQVGDLPALLGRLDPPEGEHASFAVAWRPGGARAAATTPREVLAEARLLLLTASSGGPLPEHVTPADARLEGLRARARAARAGASPRFDELVFVSAPMVELVALLGQVAASDVSVLITGETGTGKERIARALHAHGPRARGPFVAISCAALPEALLESELFGHVRGAFTGATAHHEGLLVAASGGTLFLDEVGDAPLGIQRKLLRVLQERRVRPVGSGAEVPFDVRVVAATHRDLRAAAVRGEFREDLFFRLAVVTIEVPPLRARGEDVLLLAQELLEEHHAAGRTAVRGLTDAAAERLLRHTWPGNVRELRNCIDRAVALARHPWLTVADLPASLGAPSAGPAPDDPGALVSLAELELAHMRRVLHAVGGNKTVAARILGCDRRTLYRKLGPDAGADAPESH